MIKLIPLYYLENLLSDEIFEGGTCSLKGQRSPNEHTYIIIEYVIYTSPVVGEYGLKTIYNLYIYNSEFICYHKHVVLQ